MSSYNDPFDALFALQRALDARLASDWLGAGTAARALHTARGTRKAAHDQNHLNH